MKKLVLLAGICILLACKSENKSAILTDTIDSATDSLVVPKTKSTTNPNLENLINNKWVLESATVTPAMTQNGKTSSNYLELQGESSCIASNFTYIFLENGIYKNSSTGAACTLRPNGDDQRWSIADNKIILTNKYGSSNPFIFNGSTITQTGAFVNEKVNYSIVYVYKPIKLDKAIKN
jgi:hypothetical protein